MQTAAGRYLPQQGATDALIQGRDAMTGTNHFAAIVAAVVVVAFGAAG